VHEYKAGLEAVTELKLYFVKSSDNTTLILLLTRWQNA
jgi:hypothetical protein